MANVISDETIEYVGILAKLELSDEEKEAAKKDMASMLDYIDKLGELDTTGVEPMSHVFPVNNVMREDVVTMVTEVRQLLLMHLNVMNQDLLYLKLLNHRKDAYEFIRLYSC